MDDTADVVPTKPTISITKEGRFTLEMDLSAIGPALAHGGVHMCHGHIDAWFMHKAQEAQAKAIVKPTGIAGAIKSAIWRK